MSNKLILKYLQIFFYNKTALIIKTNPNVALISGYSSKYNKPKRPHKNRNK